MLGFSIKQFIWISLPSICHPKWSTSRFKMVSRLTPCKGLFFCSSMNRIKPDLIYVAKIADVTACKNKFFKIESCCVFWLVNIVWYFPILQKIWGKVPVLVSERVLCKPRQDIEGRDNLPFSTIYSGRHKKRALYQGPFSVMKFIEQIIVRSAVHLSG